MPRLACRRRQLTPKRGGDQVIPRPPGVRSGRRPPWAGQAPASVTVADVRRAMAEDLQEPFEVTHVAARESTAPLPRVPDLPLRDPRPAAVLCPVFGEAPDQQAHLVLTRRSGRLRSHTGEVSFPGGRLDPGEPAVGAALREAREEVGIEPATVEVIGELSALSTWSSSAAIRPFVGLLPGRPQLRPNPAEVARAFTVPVAELFADGVGSEELWPLPGGEVRPIYFYALDGDTVWGATARILRELLDRLWAVQAGASPA